MKGKVESESLQHRESDTSSKQLRVVLGMSGGVDSSVAALLLKKQGYEVYGYFMNCGVRGKTMWPSSIDWKEDEEILKKICKKLKIELRMADCEMGYEKKIIGPMFEDYKKGLTPNPDILCNNVGKFPNLFKIAEEIGADYIATGHYARIKRKGKGTELLMGKDKNKDQSYFLCGLPDKILNKCLFPIGEYTKEEVRDIAKKNKFPNWNKRGSRGICYLGKIDMKKFMKQRIVEMEGELLSVDREIVGTHPGSVFFTIGERIRDSKGFVFKKKFRRLYGGKKLYVAEKLKGNKIVVAPEKHEALMKKNIFVKNLEIIDKDERVDGKRFKARVRHLGELLTGRLGKEGGKWSFVFDKGVEGVAEGQFLVLYDKQRVVGCGEIRLG